MNLQCDSISTQQTLDPSTADVYWYVRPGCGVEHAQPVPLGGGDELNCSSTVATARGSQRRRPQMSMQRKPLVRVRDMLDESCDRQQGGVGSSRRSPIEGPELRCASTFSTMHEARERNQDSARDRERNRDQDQATSLHEYERC